MEHCPVLLKEVLQYLDLKEGQTVLDATLGSGGHSAAICEKLGEKGRVVGIEQDASLINDAECKVQSAKCKVDVVNGNFRDLDALMKSLKIKKVDAVLFDLGMNSLQLGPPAGGSGRPCLPAGRGFSFQKDEPLIMTYKSELGPGELTAGEILNTWPQEEIFKILKEYGEERYARRISRAITEARKISPFQTTLELAEAVRRNVPAGYRHRRIHPATKTFQALRIAVNDELGALQEGLAKAWFLLGKNGRLMAISFHSMEDRLVKNFFRTKKESGEGMILVKKPVMAGREEVLTNPRSRSAKLRIILKTK